MKRKKRENYVYRVIQEERLIFYEVIISVIVRKKS
jgi:hypothetical protein